MIRRAAARVSKDREGLDPQLTRINRVQQEKAPRKTRHKLCRNGFGRVMYARAGVPCIRLRFHFTPIAILGVASAKRMKQKLIIGEADLNLGETVSRSLPFADELFNVAEGANR